MMLRLTHRDSLPPRKCPLITKLLCVYLLVCSWCAEHCASLARARRPCLYVVGRDALALLQKPAALLPVLEEATVAFFEPTQLFCRLPVDFLKLGVGGSESDATLLCVVQS